MMPLALILFVTVLLGMLFLGYALNLEKERNENRRNTMQSGRDVHDDSENKSAHVK